MSAEISSYVEKNNLRDDANRVALKAVRAILDAAESFEIDVEGTIIRVKVERQAPGPWPAKTWGLDEREDGPWPQAVVLDCAWDGGKTQIVAEAQRAGGIHQDLVSILFRAVLIPQQLVWINVAAWIQKDIDEVPFEAWFSVGTRIPDDPVEKQRRDARIADVRRLVGRSGLPLSGSSRIDAFTLAIPGAEVSPSPALAWRRLAHLALLKLPFWVRNQREVIQGRPYFDPDAPVWRGSDPAPPPIVDVEEPAAAAHEAPPEEDLQVIAIPKAPVDAAALKWAKGALELAGEEVRAFAEKRKLRASPVLFDQLAAAVSSGKHLLLVGPPGTGKTQMALALADAAQNADYTNGAFVATAAADWSTFNTIGGFTINKEGGFVFRSGVFLQAIEQRKWLIIDEINRADIDRCFGELMTVLAGERVDTHFTDEKGKAISIGHGGGDSHRVTPAFRLIATMNTWDKTSLFRLSYAVQRRFAVIFVGPPDDATFAALIDEAAQTDDGSPPLDEAAAGRMKRLFCRDGLLRERPIGPAIALDMIRYQRRRQAGGDGFFESVSLFLLPQLEGLDVDRAARIERLLRSDERWASAEATREMRERFAEQFPGLDRP